MSDTLDVDLLKLFKNKENFINYFQFIDYNLLASEIKVILEGYEEYYKTHNNDITYRAFVPWFFDTLHRNWLPDEIKYFKSIFQYALKLPDVELEATLCRFKEKKLWSDLEKLKNDNFDTEGMEETLKNYNSNINKKISTIPYLDPEELLLDAAESTKLKWRLNSLNYHWGDLQKGQLYLVTATTHTGKSSFLISETSYFLSALGDKNLLYFNNERSEKAIMERYLCTLFKVPITTLRKHITQALKDYYTKYPNKPIKIFSARNGKKSLKEIEAACASHNPGVVVIDQLDKLTSNSDAHLRRPYEMLYSWARNLAVKYDIPVIGVTQYGVKKDQYGNERCDNMSQHGTFDSTIDKAANTDFMLGIQKIESADNCRRIYLIRAKEGHEGISFVCNFNKDTGVYSDD